MNALFRDVTMGLSRKMRAPMLLSLILLLSRLTLAQPEAAGIAPKDPRAASGATVTYVLPTDGELPRTYRVTLAVVDPQNPDWIVSTFVAGAPRTVTAENKGRFTETWDGLDDNFMPVPP